MVIFDDAVAQKAVPGAAQTPFEPVCKGQPNRMKQCIPR